MIAVKKRKQTCNFKTMIQTQWGRLLIFALLHILLHPPLLLLHHRATGQQQIVFTLLSCERLWHSTAAVRTGAAGKEIKETNDTWRLHLGGQRTMSSYCDYAPAIVNMCFCWVYINLHMFPNSPGDGKPLGTMLAFPITIRHVLCCCLTEWKRPCVWVGVCVCVREEGTLGEEGSWNWEVVLSIICGTWRERERLWLCHSVRER